jgi:hypothetical protein
MFLVIARRRCSRSLNRKASRRRFPSTVLNGAVRPVSPAIPWPLTIPSGGGAQNGKVRLRPYSDYWRLGTDRPPYRWIAGARGTPVTVDDARPATRAEAAGNRDGPRRFCRTGISETSIRRGERGAGGFRVRPTGRSRTAAQERVSGRCACGRPARRLSVS